MRNSHAKRNGRDPVIQAIANIASQIARITPEVTISTVRKKLVKKVWLVAMNRSQEKTGT